MAFLLDPLSAEGRAVGGFLPHGSCYLWNRPLMWTHLSADLVIGISYVCISALLIALMSRIHEDIPVGKLLAAFGVFIVSCGMTHFMEVITLWTPWYWTSGAIKVVTAISSAGTAILLIRLYPGMPTLIRAAIRAESAEREQAQAQAHRQAMATEVARHETAYQAQAAQIEEHRIERQSLTDELREANSELTEAATRYQLLFDVSPIPALVVDTKTFRLLAVNHAAVEQYGYAPGAYAELTLRDLCAPEDLELFDRLVTERAFQHAPRTLRPGRVKHRDATGRVFDVEAAVDQLEYKGHHAFLLIVNDVSAQRQAEEMLQLMNDRLRALFDGSPLAVVATDLAGRVMMWNPAAERLFGWNVAEVVGRPAPMITPETTDDENTYQRALDGPYHAEVQRRRKDGALITVELSTAPLHDRNGHIVGAMHMMTDVTTEKQLEAQLSHAQKMEAVGQLAGGVAHDFNNMLTAITGFAEFIVDELEHGQSQNVHETHTKILDDTREILRQADRGAALTRQLLTFSRRQQINLRVINLNTTVEGVDKMLRRLIGEDIHIQTQLAPEGAHVRADIGQIEQLLVNLAVNARDAMPNGGTLTIATAVTTVNGEINAPGSADAGLRLADGCYVVLSVADTGTGMDEATQRRIFEPFFTTKEPGKGTGLGLSTVYGVVHQNNGQIVVSSAPGRGSTFTIYLPQAAPVSTLSVEDPERHPARGTETVLVVEDEEAVRRLLHGTLARQGYTVLLAGDGREALNILQTRATQRRAPDTPPVDLIVSDVVMPHMNGPEFVQEVLKRFPNIPVLFTSGYLRGSIPEAVATNPSTHFISKPFTPAALLERVRRLLDREP